MTTSAPSLSLKKIDKRGTLAYDVALFVSGACGLLGTVLPFAGSQPRWGLTLVLLAIGIAGVALVFSRLPKTRYFVYFTLDESGIHHRISPVASMDLIPWDRVLAAESRYAVGEGECHSIELHLNGPANRRNPRLLEMDYRHHVDAAIAVIRGVVRSDASPKHALQTDAASGVPLNTIVPRHGC